MENLDEAQELMRHRRLKGYSNNEYLRVLPPDLVISRNGIRCARLPLIYVPLIRYLSQHIDAFRRTVYDQDLSIGPYTRIAPFDENITIANEDRKIHHWLHHAKYQPWEETERFIKRVAPGTYKQVYDAAKQVLESFSISEVPI